MSGVLVVDWLGRGGIAQTAAEWQRVLRPHVQVRMVTRAGLEIPLGRDDIGVARPRLGGRYAWHVAVVRAALSVIDRHRPDVVIIHNYIVPAFESLLLRRARRCNARTVLVVHNRQPHQRSTGVMSGLDRLVAEADELVAHSHFVAERLERIENVRVMPLPRPSLLLSGGSWQTVVSDEPPPTLLHFGVMGRRYKGTDMIDELALMDDFGWRFRLVGAMASTRVGPAPRLSVRPGYLEGDELVREIRAAAAVALPYRAASQSAALVLAQAVGRPPIATAVGGLGEQIEDGVDGILMAPDSTPDEWRRSLLGLTSTSRRRMGMAGVARAERAQAAFEEGVLAVARESSART